MCVFILFRAEKARAGNVTPDKPKKRIYSDLPTFPEKREYFLKSFTYIVYHIYAFFASNIIILFIGIDILSMPVRKY